MRSRAMLRLLPPVTTPAACRADRWQHWLLRSSIVVWREKPEFPLSNVCWHFENRDNHVFRLVWMIGVWGYQGCSIVLPVSAGVEASLIISVELQCAATLTASSRLTWLLKATLLKPKLVFHWDNFETKRNTRLDTHTWSHTHTHTHSIVAWQHACVSVFLFFYTLS